MFKRVAVSTTLITGILAANVYLCAVLKVVPLRHVIFVLFTSSYALLANLFILRSSASVPLKPMQPRSLTPVKNSVRLLFPFTCVFSLLAPTSLLASAPPSLGSIVAPHLFLMRALILAELIGFLAGFFFTVYVRLGVTIAFVAYRLPVIVNWYKHAVAWAQTDEAKAAQTFMPALAQATAVLNLVFWSFALLCFLLLYCLPAVIRQPQILVPIETQRAQRSSVEDKPEDR